MTHRLYYNDPYLQAFDATVVRAEPRGERLGVWLDRTAFYPTSGGQPFDTGTLVPSRTSGSSRGESRDGPLRVVDVVDEDDGTIVHVVEPSSEKLEPGQGIHGVVDWPRRFDHMQQHTGQHVLSAAIARLFDVRTVSFHLGAEASTIDLARELSPAEIAAAETEANRVVWEDRPVGIRFASAEEAAALPLRKEPVRGGTLRLIDIEHFDLSACGGTHVARTGGVGVIAVASWERFKGGQRISFLCGGRALAGYRTLRDAMTGAVRLLSVLPEELPASIERLQAEAKEQKRATTALQADLARYRAEELAASAVEMRLKTDSGASPARRLVARVVDADANGLKALATAVVAKPGHLVVLVSTAMPALVVAARSADIDVSVQRLLASLFATFGGRGGGKPDFAQGGGLVAPSPQAILDAAVRDL
jgi:alanyl-tRNA synthetase